MPLYQYECGACRHRDTEFQHMADAHLTKCPQCSTDQYHRVPTVPHTPQLGYHKPIEMMSIAMQSDEDIANFRKNAPGVPISSDKRDPNYGIPIAENRIQKKQALKAMGFVEKK